MNALELKKRREAGEDTSCNLGAHLIYGDPGAGKTRLAGTTAAVKGVERIYWFDLENGFATVLNQGLTDEQLEKITFIRIADSVREPIAMETVAKALTAANGVEICEEHGKVGCSHCKKEGKPFISFNMRKLGTKDVVVLDSLSQLGQSALSLAMLGRDVTAKAEFDDYGAQGKMLTDILSIIQACKNTNFVVITHVEAVTTKVNGLEKTSFYPQVGTRKYSMTAGKYFGSVIYCGKDRLGKHAAYSGSTALPDRVTKSREGVEIEKQKTLDISGILCYIGGTK
jgi:hypothetical protein